MADNADPNAEHRRAWDAIAWVVAGSASAAEREFVAAHVAGCEDCRAELAFQRQLQAGMQLDSAVTQDPAPALQQLWARVDAADLTPQPAPPSRPPAFMGWTRVLAAAVVVQAVGLALLGSVLWEQQNRSADYQTLSQPAPAVGATLRFVPAPQLDLASLRALLARHGLKIVETSPDASSLLLAPSHGGLQPADPLALARLRAEPGVLLLEPVGR